MEGLESDAVQLYLTQMGNVPLLSRQAEQEVAKRIEISRRRYRSNLLGFGFHAPRLRGNSAKGRLGQNAVRQHLRSDRHRVGASAADRGHHRREFADAALDSGAEPPRFRDRPGAKSSPPPNAARPGGGGCSAARRRCGCSRKRPSGGRICNWCWTN